MCLGDQHVVGLARVLSKLGYCSRTEAADLIRAARVTINGRVVRNPEHPTDLKRDVVKVDGQRAVAAERVYVALNKPRGLVTTARDEQGRETVFQCFANADLPKLQPVGRLDKASEGLLLFTNDSAWAAGITSPDSEITKVYHVQIDRILDEASLVKLRHGVKDNDEWLKADAVELLRTGEKQSWLAFTLSEGRNRQIRRMVASVDAEVRRLIRVQIGPLKLGELLKGDWRKLSRAEVQSLR